MGLSTPLWLGLTLGVQHATDPDHVVAVATILSHERRFSRGALVGLLWGLGHTAALLGAGGLVVALRLRIPAWIPGGLELLVAVALVALGAVRVLAVLRELRALDRAHLWADHDHDARAAFHSHLHGHGAGAPHRHPHVHPSRTVLGVLGGGLCRTVVSSFAIGAVHGLSGTAAVSLLVLTTFGSRWQGLAYLLAFGAGTVVGMTVLTASLAWPVSAAVRFDRVRHAVGILTGLGAMTFGFLYGVTRAANL